MKILKYALLTMALFFVAAFINSSRPSSVEAGQSMGRVVYGNGVPDSSTPDCTQTMVYINSLTGNLYTSSLTTSPAMPCSWALKAAGTPYNPAAVAITGGAIDGTTIGATTPEPVNATGVVAAINGAFSSGGGYTFAGNPGQGMWYQSGNMYFSANGNQFEMDSAGNQWAPKSFVANGSPQTGLSGTVVYGGTTAAASNCNQGGTLTSVVGCDVIAANGLTHYLPYF